MSDVLDLLDYRRRVFELYAAVRGGWSDDPTGAHQLWAGTRDRLFGEHPQSALPADERRAFRGLDYWPYEPAWAFTAELDTDVAPDRYEIGTSTGGPLAFVRAGQVELPIGRLDVFWLDAYGGGLFVPFRDATAGDTTYGGGRYLLDTVKGADLGTSGRRLVLDCNFAYHPSCAYAPEWSCPLAPPSNRLEVAVTAGERTRRR